MCDSSPIVYLPVKGKKQTKRRGKQQSVPTAQNYYVKDFTFYHVNPHRNPEVMIIPVFTKNSPKFRRIKKLVQDQRPE